MVVSRDGFPSNYELSKLLFSTHGKVYDSLLLFRKDSDKAKDRLAEVNEEHKEIVGNLTRDLEVHRGIVESRQVDCPSNLM